MTTSSTAQIILWIAVLLLVLASAKVLLKGSWFIAWLKGCAGVFLLCLAAMLASMAGDIRSYKPLLAEQTIAKIRFTEFKPHIYIATIGIPGEAENAFELHGDQWQLDTRIISWRGMLASLDIEPLYRLGRLSGRYMTLEEERNNPRYVHELGASGVGVDTWKLLQGLHNTLPWIRLQYGSAVYMPMAHNARYELVLNGSSLLATPVSEEAVAAFDSWM
ncbi:MAG: cation/multidrug efflux pump [Pseudomonadota bacterium]